MRRTRRAVRRGRRQASVPPGLDVLGHQERRHVRRPIRVHRANLGHVARDEDLGGRAVVRLLFDPDKAIDEFGDRVDRLLGHLGRRRVLAVEMQAPDRAAGALLDRVELRHRPVLVALTLDQQQRTRDPLELVGDAPIRELRIEPHVVPAEERGVGVPVVARHLLAQVAVDVDLARSPDLIDANLLDEHVRRDRHDRGNRVMGGVDQRDRGAVAVADEHRAFYADGCEEVGEHLERLLVHERRGPRRWRPVRLPVPVSRERHRAPAGSRCEPLGKVPPQPDRPEPLVQEHEGRLIAIARDIEKLELASRKGESRRRHRCPSLPRVQMQTAPGGWPGAASLGAGAPLLASVCVLLVVLLLLSVFDDWCSLARSGSAAARSPTGSPVRSERAPRSTSGTRARRASWGWSCRCRTSPTSSCRRGSSDSPIRPDRTSWSRRTNDRRSW